MKNFAGGDFEYLTALMPIGDDVFDIFDIIKFDFTKKIFNFVDAINEKLYKVSSPRIKSFKKQDILSSKNLKNDEEFKKYILDVFERGVNKTLKIIKSHDDFVDPEIIKTVERVISEGKEEKLKNDIKNIVDIMP